MYGRLEDKYSWPELGNLVADRIVLKQFLDVKTFKREKFLSWFAEREKIGMVFDWRLVARCYVICDQLQKKNDHFTVIVGGEGKGKSTLAQQMAAWINPELTLDSTVFNLKDYLKQLTLATEIRAKEGITAKGLPLCPTIDEGGIDLFSRESMSKSNRILAKTFMVQRFLKLSVTICIPFYWGLDPYIRQHRVNTLIVIRERGQYKAVVGKGIKILNMHGKKDKDKPMLSIAVPYGTFWEGTFSVRFPKTISRDDYEAHKFKHIKNFLRTVSEEAETLEFIHTEKVEAQLGLRRGALTADIQSGKYEGKMIGNKWYLTQKGYKTLSGKNHGG